MSHLPVVRLEVLMSMIFKYSHLRRVSLSLWLKEVSQCERLMFRRVVLLLVSRSMISGVREILSRQREESEWSWARPEASRSLKVWVDSPKCMKKYRG